MKDITVDQRANVITIPPDFTPSQCLLASMKAASCRALPHTPKATHHLLTCKYIDLKKKIDLLRRRELERA